MRLNLFAILATVFCLGAQPALAASNPLPMIAGAGTTTPVAIIGYDSMTDLPCIVGSDATCSFQISGGGGGGVAITAAAGSYAVGALLDGASVTSGAEADAACATDNGTCTLQALTKRLNQRLTTLITALGTPAPAYGTRIAATVTRPANTTTYGANTAIANATSGATYTTFTGVCRAVGSTVLITEVLVMDGANQTTKLQGVLDLFSVPPATPINDNAAFNIAGTPTSGDLSNMVATISFSPTTVTNQGSGASGSTVADIPGAGSQATCASGDTNLYGLWEATNAYVPVSAEPFTAVLKVTGVN